MAKALHDDPRPGCPVRPDDRFKSYVVATVCGDPFEGFDRWTLELIKQRLVEQLGQQKGSGTAKGVDVHLSYLTRGLYSYVNGYQEESLRYDKAGRLLNRATAGAYHYNTTSPNAVSSIENPFSGSTLSSYTYNGNGSMNSRDGKQVVWNPSNKPYQVKSGATVLSQFLYGFDRERIRQDTPNEDIYYFGNVEWTWNVASSADIETRIYLNAPTGRIGVHLKDSSLNPQETRYFHTDHLGSIELVTNN